LRASAAVEVVSKFGTMKNMDQEVESEEKCLRVARAQHVRAWEAIGLCVKRAVRSLG